MYVLIMTLLFTDGQRKRRGLTYIDFIKRLWTAQTRNQSCPRSCVDVITDVSSCLVELSRFLDEVTIVNALYLMSSLF